MSAEVKNQVQTLLRFITCGSVDDGKSTLIGHMLYSAKLLYTDQQEALELESKVGSRDGKIDYSLLLDGLAAEREQGITIDVAYRYFTTSKRSFIVADTPGHEEYIRNMAVGASFADLAIILVDGSKGVLVQTRRHARICALMGIRFFIFAVNKMDLIGYDEAKFRKIENDIKELSKELNLESVQVIPVSATEGDNINTKSKNIPWYDGDAILPYLEKVDITPSSSEEGFYLPVQRVCRPNREFRGFQGQIESSTVSLGDAITVYPSGEKANIKGIFVGDRKENSAFAGQPVTLELDREVDVSRGCVIANNTQLSVTQEIIADILWTDDNNLTEHSDVFIKIGSKLIPGSIDEIRYAVDVNSGEHEVKKEIAKNEIASVRISFSDRVVTDTFKRHRTLGEFIVIDRVTNMTSACGTVTEVVTDSQKTVKSVQDFRAELLEQSPLAVYFDAKNFFETLVEKVEKLLLQGGRHTYLYKATGDEAANKVIKNLVDAGLIVLVYSDKKPENLDNVKLIDDSAFGEDLSEDRLALLVRKLTA